MCPAGLTSHTLLVVLVDEPLLSLSLSLSLLRFPGTKVTRVKARRATREMRTYGREDGAVPEAEEGKDAEAECSGWTAARRNNKVC